MKTVKLITCSDAAQAHIIQGALENEGISSLLHNENMSTLLRGYINDIAGVDVLVDEADYEAAVRLLEQNEMIPEQLKYCPFCGSPDIKATPPGNNHWEYVCHACGGKFEKPVAEFHSAEV